MEEEEWAKLVGNWIYVSCRGWTGKPNHLLHLFYFGNFIFSSKCSWFTVLCRSLLYSRVTKLYSYRDSSFHILFRYVILSQDVECSSLHCCLSVLDITVYICLSQTPRCSLPTLPQEEDCGILLHEFLQWKCKCRVPRGVRWPY